MQGTVTYGAGYSGVHRVTSLTREGSVSGFVDDRAAYTPKGYINNAQQDFGSILRFVEHNFGIAEGALNFDDARSKGDLSAFFDFTQPPRTFKMIPAPKGAAFFLHDTRPQGDPDDE